MKYANDFLAVNEYSTTASVEVSTCISRCVTSLRAFSAAHWRTVLPEPKQYSKPRAGLGKRKHTIASAECGCSSLSFLFVCLFLSFFLSVCLSFFLLVIPLSHRNFRSLVLSENKCDRLETLTQCIE